MYNINRVKFNISVISEDIVIPVKNKKKMKTVTSEQQFSSYVYMNCEEIIVVLYNIKARTACL